MPRAFERKIYIFDPIAIVYISWRRGRNYIHTPLSARAVRTFLRSQCNKYCISPPGSHQYSAHLFAPVLTHTNTHRTAAHAHLSTQFCSRSSRTSVPHTWICHSFMFSRSRSFNQPCTNVRSQRNRFPSSFVNPSPRDPSRDLRHALFVFLNSDYSEGDVASAPIQSPTFLRIACQYIHRLRAVSIHILRVLKPWLAVSIYMMDDHE